MAERLVHEQHVGLDRERPGDPDALLHATGELAGVLVHLVAKLDHVEVALASLACGVVVSSFWTNSRLSITVRHGSSRAA